MPLIIQPDYAAISQTAANEIIQLIRQQPNAVICIASGDSPKLACQYFVQQALQEKLDLSQFFFVGLDEWVGLDGSTKGSCRYDFENRLFGPLQLPATQYHLFDGKADDLQEECIKMDAIIEEKGGIDLMIVGIGMNGHIGFNEPGVDASLLSHVIGLDETTRTVGKKYFDEPVALTQGITLGLGHLLQAKKVILMANGERKAPIVQQALEQPVSEGLPASILQQHPQGIWLIDELAAASLNHRG